MNQRNRLLGYPKIIDQFTLTLSLIDFLTWWTKDQIRCRIWNAIYDTQNGLMLFVVAFNFLVVPLQTKLIMKNERMLKSIAPHFSICAQFDGSGGSGAGNIKSINLNERIVSRARCSVCICDLFRMNSILYVSSTIGSCLRTLICISLLRISVTVACTLFRDVPSTFGHIHNWSISFSFGNLISTFGICKQKYMNDSGSKNKLIFYNNLRLRRMFWTSLETSMLIWLTLFHNYNYSALIC